MKKLIIALAVCLVLLFSCEEVLTDMESDVTDGTEIATNTAAETEKVFTAEETKPTPVETDAKEYLVTEPPHEHSFSNATCTSPKTCSDCGATEGDAMGHSFLEPTCTSPKACSTCGVTEGYAIGHLFLEPTCTEPKTCSTCGVTEGYAIGHLFLEPTCTEPKTCSTCGATEGSAMGHYYSGGKCTNCGEAGGEPADIPGKENYNGHVYTGGDKSTKYHYEGECAGKYSHEITWAEVQSRGLGPCGTCVLK